MLKRVRLWLKPFSQTRLFRISTTLVLIGLLFFAVTHILKRETFKMSAGETSLQMTPALPGGDVIVPLGPLGELSWKAHKAPLTIEASLIIGADAKKLPSADQLTRLPRGFVIRKLPWLFLLGFLLAIPAAIKSRKKLIALGTVAIIPPLIFAGLVGMTIASFNERAFENPHYRGPIGDAPRVLAMVKDIQGNWQTFRERIDETVRGIYALHKEITAGYNPTNKTVIRFLIVSDIHSNPAAFPLIVSLAKNFSVDAILDAGDHITLGWEQETYLFPQDLHVPYLITPGNHESEAAVNRLRQEGAEILDSSKRDMADPEGILVLGDRDPNSYNPGTETPDDQTLLDECMKLLTRFQKERPSIVMVHNPLQAECVADYAETEERSVIVISGHTHVPHFKQSKHVIRISPGTSGAGGVKSTSSYGFTILEFRRDTLAPSNVCMIEFQTPTAYGSYDCDPLQNPE